MDRYFARIVLALITSIAGIGGGIGLMVFIVLVIKGSPRAFQVGLQSGVSMGCTFAFLLVLVFLLLDLSARLYAAKGHYKEIWELEQTREATVAGSLREVTGKARQALLAVPNVRSVSDNAADRSLSATIGPSIRSPGEAMAVNLEDLGENSWKLRCVSRPVNRVFFDYAKNFDNVETFLKCLEQGSTYQ